MRVVQVPLGERSYEVRIAAGLLRSAGDWIADEMKPTAALLVTHPSLTQYCDLIGQGLRRAGIRIETAAVPSGERYKTLRTVERLYGRMVSAGLDRRSLVVAVGGGVMGDVAGFAAATYLRGIRCVQAPTTLLAQVDASIGGKTGVDLPAGKNLVGAFHQPAAVLIDTDTLRTLPARELRSGLAEVVKYGIICDAELFCQVAGEISGLLRREASVLEPVIARCCAIKAEVVSSDETEQGRRAILNFGHTVGHALEMVTGYRRYRHGEAVAIGMVSAALIGEEIGRTPPDVASRMASVLRSAGLPVAFPQDVDMDGVISALARDKKSVAGQARFVLASRIGDVEAGVEVAEEPVRRALQRQLQY